MKKYVIIGEKFAVSPEARTLDEALSSVSTEGELNGPFDVLGEADSLEEAEAMCREKGLYSWYNEHVTRGVGRTKWRDVYFVQIWNLNDPDPDYEEKLLDLIDECQRVMPFKTEAGETEDIVDYDDRPDEDDED